MKVMPELNPELCDGCGLCVIACHGGAIIKEDDRVRIEVSEDCDFCGVCEAVCPQQAITCFYLIVPA
jgi:MinD superfamily P-loop ATPase